MLINLVLILSRLSQTPYFFVNLLISLSFLLSLSLNLKHTHSLICSLADSFIHPCLIFSLFYLSLLLSTCSLIHLFSLLSYSVSLTHSFTHSCFSFSLSFSFSFSSSANLLIFHSYLKHSHSLTFYFSFLLSLISLSSSPPQPTPSSFVCILYTFHFFWEWMKILTLHSSLTGKCIKSSTKSLIPGNIFNLRVLWIF